MIINGIYWRIIYVSADSKYLTRSDGSTTIGMTDGKTHTIYLYRGLEGYMLDKVLAHEMVHAFMFSYDIHIDIEDEEFMADWVSIYGRELIYMLDKFMQSAKRA